MTPQLKQLRKILDKKRLDGALFLHQGNIRYITEFPSTDAYLLVTPKENFFLTDARYDKYAKLNLKGFKVKLIHASVFDAVLKLISSAKIKRLGFEAGNVSMSHYKKIKAGLNSVRFIDISGLVETLRIKKSEAEITKIRGAVKIAVETMKYAKTIIRPGIKELEVAGELERFIRYQGARTTAFNMIVASGQNSAFPHHLASDDKLRKADPVIIDLGVNYGGYKSDLTRTFFLDRIPPKISNIYNIVSQAQSLAINKVRPGIKICEIDNCARQHITKHGYGKFFTHGLGHGIGLEIHEKPSITIKNKTLLEEGMVFTIEPGVYLPSQFGIRIEDDILVTKNGCEVLSADLNK